MTRKQKYTLLVLGVLDFIVIAALGAIVIRALSPTPPPPAFGPAQISPCAQTMLAACNSLPAPFRNPATVAWDAQQLYVTLQAVYPAATPPSESAQLLWTALDEISGVFQRRCLVPETITLTLTAHGSAETVQYLAQLAGQDVAAWMAGTLPEETLAAQSHFRQTPSATELTDRTD